MTVDETQENKPLSRQRAWQLKMVAEGRCSKCGKKAVVKGYCQFHYEKKKEQVIESQKNR